MVQGVSTGETGNGRVQDNTVFGDSADEGDKASFSTFSSLTTIAKNSSTNCSMQ